MLHEVDIAGFERACEAALRCVGSTPGEYAITTAYETDRGWWFHVVQRERPAPDLMPVADNVLIGRESYEPIMYLGMPREVLVRFGEIEDEPGRYVDVPAEYAKEPWAPYTREELEAAGMEVSG